ncbi:MAG: hypothetical protein QNJ41_05245 [Xenococcaceae cyanobacterium MO_188.B32]|nr:hypothetical protein [Xenococcaceae cyanobacterium MO_188.B32]
MSVLLSFLGLAHIPHKNEQVRGKEREVNTFDERKEMKLAQLESYMSADDNQGIANLALYL